MKKFLAIAAVAALSVSTQASALDLVPRLGVSLSNADTVRDSSTDFGFSAGLGISTDNVFGDLSFESLRMTVRDPKNTGFNTNMVDGWRTEIAATIGTPIWESLSLIGGYRGVQYGTSVGKSNSATMHGPFIGLSAANLRMTEKDIFSITFAIQPTTYKAKSGSYGEESDVGMSIRIGYRRAGSPHSFSVRYQSFGGDRSYDEYLTTLQYNYLF